MNITDYLLERGADDDVCLFTPTRNYSRRELRDAVCRLAHTVESSGGHIGDRIVLLAENSFFWVAAYLAIMRAGRICVPLAPSISVAELQYVLRSVEPSLACVHSKIVHRVREEFLHTRIITEEELHGLSVSTPARIRGDHDTATLMFTSGSTGKPRGVMVTHRNIAANTDSIIEYLRLTAADRTLAVLPFHYCFGTSLLHTHLRVGASLVLECTFMFPDQILERMQATHCTGFAGVPSHYQILLQRPGFRQMHLPDLRFAQQAGGHLAPVFVDKLRAALPSTDIYLMYGQTEATARLAFLPPTMLDRKVGSIGKAIPGVELQVVDEAGNQCPPGTVGELRAQGANITAGYWKEPEETAATYREVWLYTGDLAKTDDDGFIYLADRAKDFLKCAGQRVSSRQLEDWLLEIPGVREAAVIGVPDPLLGEAVKAFVVPSHNGANGIADTVRSFCKQRFPLQLLPREIVILDTLPKNEAGKVLKASLRAHGSRSA